MSEFLLAGGAPVFSAAILRRPSPLLPLFSSIFLSLGTRIDVGLELLGVPLGVLLGVDDALSTLAFRKPDLGVTFEFRNSLAADSSLAIPLGVWGTSGLPSFATRGESRGEEAATRRGAMVRGLPPRAARIGLFVVTPLDALFCFSRFMSPFARVAAIVEQACRVRIATLLSKESQDEFARAVTGCDRN